MQHRCIWLPKKIMLIWLRCCCSMVLMSIFKLRSNYQFLSLQMWLRRLSVALQGQHSA
jgi:hypothetical protein